MHARTHVARKGEEIEEEERTSSVLPPSSSSSSSPPPFALTSTEAAAATPEVVGHRGLGMPATTSGRRSGKYILRPVSFLAHHGQYWKTMVLFVLVSLASNPARPSLYGSVALLPFFFFFFFSLPKTFPYQERGGKGGGGGEASLGGYKTSWATLLGTTLVAERQRR